MVLQGMLGRIQLSLAKSVFSMESDPEKGRHHQRHQHRQEEQRQQKQKPSPSLQSESQSELENQASRSSSGCAASQETAGPAATTKKYLQWVARIKGLETRGIEPVPVEERHGMHAATAVRMMCIWFSMTLATNNLIVGSLGTLVFRLSFTDAALCAVFGVILGNIAVAYISTWGPRSGNRTLVCPPSLVFGFSWPSCRWLMCLGLDPLLHGVLSHHDMRAAERVHESGIQHAELRGRRPDPLQGLGRQRVCDSRYHHRVVVELHHGHVWDASFSVI